MLVFKDHYPNSWLEEIAFNDDDELSDEWIEEEGAPQPVPVVIVVAYDWRSRCWRWFLESTDRQSAFHLLLPEGKSFPIVPGTDKRKGDPPQKSGATFEVTYSEHSQLKSWKGKIVELHLDHSHRTYGKPLSASEILESWRGVGSYGGGTRKNDGDEDDNNSNNNDDSDHSRTNIPAAFDAVNLYDLFRAIRSLRARIEQLESQPHALRALLVGSSNSVMSLARLAEREGEALVVRYLVLRELSNIVKAFKLDSFDVDLLSNVHKGYRQAKKTTLSRLATELGINRGEAKKILDWFEKKLKRLDS